MHFLFISNLDTNILFMYDDDDDDVMMMMM